MTGILSRVPRRFVQTWPRVTEETLKQHEKTANLWKKLTFFVAAPALIIVGINTYLSEIEHQQHYKRPEFVNYDHLRIINAPFPWGDGKHPLFFNPKINATKKGYETEE